MQKSNTEGLLNSIKSKFTFKFKLLHIFFFSIFLLAPLCWVAKKYYTQQLQVQNSLMNLSLFFPNSRLSGHVFKLWPVSGLPTQATLSTVGMDVSYHVVCADTCLEAESELGKPVALQMGTIQTLHSEAVANSMCPDTFLYIACNNTAHCISNFPIWTLSSTQAHDDWAPRQY